MPTRDIIVVGTSTGGVEALTELARGLPSGLPASVFVVCHFPAGGRSVLPQILSRAGPILASHAEDGQPFHPGQIYVAPPDRHLMLGPEGRMRLSRHARENHHRPAIDPLFRTAARYYGPRVVGVVLTGALYDGTAGLMAVRAGGGLAVVQAPDDALVAAMPENAARLAGLDHMVRIHDLAPLLARLVRERAPAPGPNPNPNPGPVGPLSEPPPMDPLERMNAVVDQDMARQARDQRRGEVSVFTCPECGGALWQVDEPSMVRFRCHVGHVYGAEVLLSEQTEALEAALWTAVRTFKEKWVLASQMAHRERARGHADLAERYDEQARQAAEFGHLIERHLLQGNGTPVNDGPLVQDRQP
jgi:two-component system chemotaxis response regulator CheB